MYQNLTTKLYPNLTKESKFKIQTQTLKTMFQYKIKSKVNLEQIPILILNPRPISNLKQINHNSESKSKTNFNPNSNVLGICHVLC